MHVDGPRDAGRPCVTWTTDFGSADGYVARMRGAFLAHGAAADWIDVSHDVPPGDVRRGAWLWLTLLDRFPDRTLHVAVVDPGVGGERRILFGYAAGAWWMAPDNGLAAWVFAVHPPERLFVLREEAFDPDPAPTFHGRDRFAPAAARWAIGEPVGRFAEPVEGFVSLSGGPRHRAAAPGETSTVLHVDRFGNVALDWPRRLGRPRGVRPDLGNLGDVAFLETFAQSTDGRPFLLWNSAGYLELAVRDDSAADRLGLAAGDRVRWSAADGDGR